MSDFNWDGLRDLICLTIAISRSISSAFFRLPSALHRSASAAATSTVAISKSGTEAGAAAGSFLEGAATTVSSISEKTALGVEFEERMEFADFCLAIQDPPR